MDAVVVDIDIAASPEQVWDVIMDPTRLDDWVTIHRRLGRHDAPFGEGATMEQTLCLRGVNFKVKWTVVEWDPPHRAVMEGRGPARSKARIVDELSRRDGKTHFDYRNEFKAPMGPLGSVAGRVLVGGVSEREAQASLNRLKALLER
ncbi:MAG TPA: SRPBCC family protein [Solirubrobacteraceae bacterium]|nr:SRPBCC family protein [Solirubrobacteraceae bacterium]